MYIDFIIQRHNSETLIQLSPTFSYNAKCLGQLYNSNKSNLTHLQYGCHRNYTGPVLW